MPTNQIANPENKIKLSIDKTLSRLIRTIHKAVNPSKIYLFGSRAEGTHTSDSDYDLLIIYDGPLPKNEVELKIVSSFNKHDFSMDLFILTSLEFNREKYIPMTLAREVFETGLVIDA